MNKYTLMECDIRVYNRLYTAASLTHINHLKIYYPVVLRFLERPHNRGVRVVIHFSITSELMHTFALTRRFGIIAREIFLLMGGNYFFDKLPVDYWSEFPENREDYAKLMVTSSLNMLFIKFYLDETFPYSGKSGYLCKQNTYEWLGASDE